MKNSLFVLVFALATWGFAADDVNPDRTPVPVPTSASVFDVDNDGICDSVSILYSRLIHWDSLPTMICILWDSVSAMALNPYAEGFSNNPADNTLYCNALVSTSFVNVDCSNTDPGAEQYCSNTLYIGGLRLSENVKTSGLGKVYSFAEFRDKGKNVRTAFSCDLLNPNPSTSLPPQATPLKSGLVEYTVMNLLGRVVHHGFFVGSEPVITNVVPGSYIVKIGTDVRRVNVR